MCQGVHRAAGGADDWPAVADLFADVATALSVGQDPRSVPRVRRISRARMTKTTVNSHDLIRVTGARVNNLKDVSVEIPKRQLTVFTCVRLGQEFPGLRHHRCRVAAPDQRNLQRLPPGLHAVDGPARCRPPRRPYHGDHRRPGTDGRERQIDARHRDRRQRIAAQLRLPSISRRKFPR